MVNHTPTLDRTFAALADPIRRQVVTRLLTHSATASELAGDHAISLPGFLKHLRVLEDAGLVRSEKVGRARICRVNAAPLQEAEAWMTEQRQFWEKQLDSLARYLEQSGKESLEWPKRRIASKSDADSRRRPNASTRRGPRPRR
ncbi:MAG: winged helix-turn-helix transcriptional regulator [Candidatus Eisenbacteria bacterium]|nr:winged helix-turn-helix transcriptional regulator [Candidatus Eisenbacteria bacterium]MCC7141158.1 winged helix-turn-helix transcriptional regulator [Candidatus Eisenbacteria bacterium]